MYPVKIRLHGIRDFTPRSMDLGDEQDDVLIGGKNGSGKSTLVYAMSFALVSGRVSIEGLRSKLKRKEQDFWHALVGILFHNPPSSQRKDAPEYIELVAEVKSQAGSDRKGVVYYLRGGETADKLEVIRKFPSRADARDYYKRVFDIDADGYFMFWYQGSIADFANIPDTERFRRVAEMFQLDEIQRQWQQAREEMKRAEEDFENARTVALMKKRRLLELEKHKNALEQRNHLRREGLMLFDACWRELLAIAQQEETQVRGRLAEALAECNRLQEAKEELEHRLKRARDHLEKLSREKNGWEEQATQARSRMDGWGRELSAWRQEQADLAARIADVANKMKHIHRTKEELLEEQGRLKESIARLLDEGQELSERIARLSDEEREINRQIGAAEKEKENLEESLERLQEQDQGLAAEGALAGELAAGKKRLNHCRELLGQARSRHGEKQREYAGLMDRESLLLNEQERLLKIYREAGIQAAAFGEIFRIKSGVKSDEAEAVLGPLKHTVFVERLLAKAPIEKSFYVAPVGEGVKRPWFELGNRTGEVFQWIEWDETAARRLSEPFWRGIEAWLNKVEIARAAQQPEAARGRLKLWQGALWDTHGIRGPVEKGPSIGHDALEKARAKALAELEQYAGEIAGLEDSINQTEIIVAGLAADLRLRQEVNAALPAARVRLAGLDRELAAAELRYDEITVLRKGLELDKEEKVRLREKEENLLKGVEGELAVYAEYEKEAAAVARLNELENKTTAGERQLQAEREVLSALELDIEKNWQAMQGQNREMQGMQGELNGLENELENKGARRQNLEEEADNLSIEGEEYRNSVEHMGREFDEIIQGLVRSGQWQPPEFSERERTRANLQRKVKEGRDILDDALARMVDEEAGQKYEDYALEFADAGRELEESQVRFVSLKAREEERRNEFDKAVYNRWQRTNQKFVGFMQRLSMVGDIRSVMPDPEGRNPQYQWELHVATKLGHKPEKIHPESGRVVGEGISGGERAAVSLVFALALLSDIENKPPFYVLDEFDSALDEERKHEIFDLYREVLGRKLVIISPRVHGDRYLDRFRKFHCVVANPGVLPGQAVSEVYDVTREEYREVRGQEE